MFNLPFNSKIVSLLHKESLLVSLIKRYDLNNKNQKIELKGEVPSISERKSGCVFSSRCENPSHDCKEGLIENKLIEYSKDHWVDQCCINCNKKI